MKKKKKKKKKIKNTQPQTKFTGSYKKRECSLMITISVLWRAYKITAVCLSVCLSDHPSAQAFFSGSLVFFLIFDMMVNNWNI